MTLVPDTLRMAGCVGPWLLVCHTIPVGTVMPPSSSTPPVSAVRVTSSVLVDVPSARSCCSTSTPLSTMMFPVNVFSPASTARPAPSTVMA